nr:expressed protein [Hymenolepis microstoma]
MDPQIINDLANSVSKWRMYPYFDIAHYILMSTAIREDIPQSGSAAFSRKHPFACWFATMLMCFGGAILGNFVLGESIFACFDDYRAVLTATVIWYLINYSPFDVVYKIYSLFFVRILICAMKEVQRAKKISMGVSHAYHDYPHSAVTCILVGLLKGTGSSVMRTIALLTAGVWKPKEVEFLVVSYQFDQLGDNIEQTVRYRTGNFTFIEEKGYEVGRIGTGYLEMKVFARLVRGVWLPASSEFLHPSFTTKISLLSAIVYYCDLLDLIPLSRDQLFLSVVGVMVYMRVAMLCLGLKDPFAPVQNLVCAIFFGGVVDALKAAVTRQKHEVIIDSTGGSGSGVIAPNSGAGVGQDGYGTGTGSSNLKDGPNPAPIRRTNSPNFTLNTDKKRD